MHDDAVALISLALVLSMGLGCAHQREFSLESRRPTCVVLSAGRAEALAQLGALQAIQSSALEVDCITGTGMGAVIAGLHAAAPDRDPVDHYRSFIERDVQVAGIATLIRSLLLAGWWLEDDETRQSTDLQYVVTYLELYLLWSEFSKSYEQHLGIGDGSELDLGFATYHLAITDDAVDVEAAGSGSMYMNVVTTLTQSVTYDAPGVDERDHRGLMWNRLAVPVLDTCRSFPRHQLLAINLTGEPAVLDGIRCPVLELEIAVDVPTDEAGLKEYLAGRGEQFDRATASMRERVTAALSH